MQHSGLSGELVIPSEMADPLLNVAQLKRTPSITGFESGWKKFSVVGLHLHPGNDADDKIFRKEEVRLLMEIYKEKVAKKHLWNENIIFLGDTNIYNDNADIVAQFTNAGFKECSGLLGKPTNTSLTESYDRLFLQLDSYFKLMKDSNDVEKGDVFNLFDYVLTDASRPSYHDFMLAHKNDPSTLDSDAAFETYFHRYWKRNQISDHLPVWIEIEADSTSDFLKSKMNKIII